MQTAKAIKSRITQWILHLQDIKGNFLAYPKLLISANKYDKNNLWNKPSISNENYSSQ